MRRDDYVALKEQRLEVLANARDLHEKAVREKRDLSPDEQKAWDGHMREGQRLNLEIEAMEERLREQQNSGGNPVALRGPFGSGPVDREIEKAISSVSKGESRALSTAISISPGELSTTLFDRLRAASVVLKTGIKTLNIESDSAVYPTLTADAAPAWTSEAAAITPSDPTLSTVTATPRKLAALTQVSNEVLDDSDPPLANVRNVTC
jgi:HK97 family phage major capsid protein